MIGKRKLAKQGGGKDEKRFHVQYITPPSYLNLSNFGLLLPVPHSQHVLIGVVNHAEVDA